MSLQEFASLTALHQELYQEFPYATVLFTATQTFYVFAHRRFEKLMIEYQSIHGFGRWPQHFMFVGTPLR